MIILPCQVMDEKGLLTRKSTSPHSTDRIFEDSGCSPQGQQCRRTEDLNLLCPEPRGPDSESSRTYQGARRSGTQTPEPVYCMATHICKVKVEMSKTIRCTACHHPVYAMFPRRPGESCLLKKKGRFYQIIDKVSNCFYETPPSTSYNLK